ncbi:MAG TPA: tetratricopeptide repeat protein [Luteimonas sp.]|nr:tetratricopeptide repeat protein [Luteimonas sp.]
MLRLLQAGQADEALAIGKRLVAQAAQAPDAYQLLGMCHAEAGNTEESEKAFLHALELAPNHPLVLVNYATMLRKTGRLDAALAALQRAVDTAPDHAKAWSELGVTALAAGHHQQALVALKRAVELQPGLVLAWHALGNASRATGDLDAAQAAFRTVIALAPEHRSAAINLGSVLRLSGRPDEAIACFEQIGKSGYDGPELADSLVGALLDDGRLDEAVQLARQVARQYPDFVPGLVTLANLLWEYGPALAPDDNPFDMFRAAIQHQPHNHALRAAFVQFLLSARSPEEALGQIRILRTHADEPVLVSMEANALEILGRTEQAGALYAQLHRAWGRGVPAFVNAYARHLLRAGKWDAAAQLAAEATRADPGNQEAWAYLATAWRLLDDPREGWLCDYDRLIAMVEIEPPAGFTDQSNFLEALKSTLNRMHQARREPIQQSLRGGSQTPGRLFGRRDPVLVAAQSSLLRGVESWLATLPTDDRHPFLMRKTRSVRIGGSWSVQLWSSGNHVNHIHPEGWMSSAFYVSLPPSVGSPSATGSQAGHIQFGQPPFELDLGLAPRRVIRPEAGKLALFPSYMWHGTVPFEDEQPRITVAFDMTPLADEI